MRCLIKYSLLVFVVLFVGLQEGVTEILSEETVRELSLSSERPVESQELLLLSVRNNEALPVNSIYEVWNASPAFRYLPRNSFSLRVEKYGYFFLSRFNFVEAHYRDSSFALKQNTGYYVYVLCEIIV